MKPVVQFQIVYSSYFLYIMLKYYPHRLVRRFRSISVAFCGLNVASSIRIRTGWWENIMELFLQIHRHTFIRTKTQWNMGSASMWDKVCTLHCLIFGCPIPVCSCELRIYVQKIVELFSVVYYNVFEATAGTFVVESLPRHTNYQELTYSW
jgi:hypothetical protein